MEELFVLKPENLDHLLPQIKGNLMFPNEKSQMSALEQLGKLLKSQLPVIRSNIFTKLIKFDIISTLCDILKTFREPLVTSALECLALASEYRKFYESQVAAEANIHFDQENSRKCYTSFVSCLNNMYNIRDFRQEDIANHLVANGYLKYFLRLSAQLPLHQRRNICILLTRTLITLAENSLSIDKLPEGVNVFSSRMFDGLVSLPNDVEQWTDIIAISDYRNTALMISFYYHYHATRELDMISFESLIRRLLKLEDFGSITVPILKPLWFLFAVSFLSHPSPGQNSEYESAVTKLTLALQYLELSQCYTHHIELLHFCLKCPEITNDLRYRVMNLWLIESDGDVLPLLKLDCHSVVKHCLLIIIQNGLGGVVNLAVKGIRQSMQVGNCDEIADIVWNMLPNVFLSDGPNRIEHIKAVLELSSMSEPRCLPKNTIKVCADALIKMILTEDADAYFQKLLLKQAYVILVASMEHNYFKILSKYVNETSLLEKLRDYAFSETELTLSAISLKFFTFIIHFQSLSSIKCDRPVTIEMNHLHVLLWISQKSQLVCPNALEFIHELLSQNNSGMAVTLKDVSFNVPDRDETVTILDIYEMLHVIHSKSTPVEREIVYQCLVDVLKFCHVKMETLMYHLCTAISNYDLVIGIAKTRSLCSYFLHFVTTWLRYRKIYSDDEIPPNSRSLFKSPFDETMDQLSEYMNFLKSKDENEAYSRLYHALSFFKDYKISSARVFGCEEGEVSNLFLLIRSAIFYWYYSYLCIQKIDLLLKNPLVRRQRKQNEGCLSQDSS
ncbi:hypothetical protein M0802_007624 [Mischocyttarus mexicanus]|nr:hypothetical protein M0802_007624 [Mischocyttarus mexicanus]